MHQTNARWGGFLPMLVRDGRLFLRSLLSAVLLSVLLFGGAFLTTVGFTGTDASSFTPAKVGFSAEDGSLLANLAVDLVQQQDFVSSIFSIFRMTEAEARAAVENGDIAVGLVLPPDYFDTATSMGRVEAVLLLSEGDPMINQILELFSEAGGEYIAASQYGASAGYQVLKDLDGRKWSDFYFLSISEKYVGAVIAAAGSHFPVLMTDYRNTGLTESGRYLVVYGACLLEICSLFFLGLYTRDAKHGLYSRLRASGVTTAAFLSGKILYPFLFRLLLSGGLLFALSSAGSTVSASGVLLLMLVCFLVSLLEGCLLIPLGKSRAGALLITGLTLLGLVLSGGILPLSILSPAMRTAGCYTPLGALASALSGSAGGAALAPTVILALAALAILSLGATLLYLRSLRRGKAVTE